MNRASITCCFARCSVNDVEQTIVKLNDIEIAWAEHVAIVGGVVGLAGADEIVVMRATKTTIHFWVNCPISVCRTIPLASRLRWWTHTTALSFIIGIETLPLRSSTLRKLNATQLYAFLILANKHVHRQPDGSVVPFWHRSKKHICKAGGGERKSSFCFDHDFEEKKGLGWT